MHRPALTLVMILLMLAPLGCEKAPSSPLERMARERAEAAKEAPTPAPSEAPAPAVSAPAKDDNPLSAERYPDAAIRDLIWELRAPNREKKLTSQLFAHDHDAVVAALTMALEEQDANVRTQATKILVAKRAKTRRPEVTEALVALLARERDHDVLANVVSYIHTYKADDIAEELMKLLEEHPDKMVRAYSASALGSYRYKKALPLLTNALFDAEAWVRLMSLGAIKKLKARAALPKVKRLLDDENPRVQERARETVKALGG